MIRHQYFYHVKHGHLIHTCVDIKMPVINNDADDSYYFDILKFFAISWANE